MNIETFKKKLALVADDFRATMDDKKTDWESYTKMPTRAKMEGIKYQIQKKWR